MPSPERDLPAAGSAALIVRPRAALRMAVSLSLTLLAAAALGWVLTPLQIRLLFTPIQVATLLLFLAVMVGMMLAIGLSTVRADDRGLSFRNGVRRHRFDWTQVKAFRFRDGDPWAYVLLRTDVEQLPLLGIQRTDGERAQQAVADLRRLLIAAYADRDRSDEPQAG